MITKQLLLTIIASIFITTMAYAKMKPKWVKQTPVTEEYYIGIANAPKSQNDYREYCRKKALENLASEISINISSESILNTFENKESLVQEYKQSISTNTENTLEGFELVGTWENSKEYWIYYRLSKLQYKIEKEKKEKIAIENSINHIEEGNALRLANKYQEAYYEYSAALICIEKYLGHSLKGTIKGKDIFVANEIIKSIYSLQNDLIINTNKSDFIFVNGEVLNCNEINVSVSNQEGKLTKNIPIKFWSDDKSITAYASTNEQGLACLYETKILSQHYSIKIYSCVDFFPGIQNIFPQSIALNMIGALKANVSTMVIHISKPKVFIEIKSGTIKNDVRSKLLYEIESTLFNFGFENSSSIEDANIIVQLNFEISTKYGFVSYDAFLDGQLQIMNKKTQSTLYKVVLKEKKSINSYIDNNSEEIVKQLTTHLSKSALKDFSNNYFSSTK